MSSKSPVAWTRRQLKLRYVSFTVASQQRQGISITYGGDRFPVAAPNVDARTLHDSGDHGPRSSVERAAERDWS